MWRYPPDPFAYHMLSSCNPFHLLTPSSLLPPLVRVCGLLRVGSNIDDYVPRPYLVPLVIALNLVHVFPNVALARFVLLARFSLFMSSSDLSWDVFSFLPLFHVFSRLDRLSSLPFSLSLTILQTDCLD